jgi:hypothetical protein
MRLTTASHANNNGTDQAMDVDTASSDSLHQQQTFPSSSSSSSSSQSRSLLFGTITGMVGTILTVDKRSFDFLATVQRAMQSCIPASTCWLIFVVDFVAVI